MRVIEPQQLPSDAEAGTKPARNYVKAIIPAAILLIAIGAVCGWYFIIRPTDNNQVSNNAEASVNVSTADVPVATPKKGVLKVLTSQQFRDLYNTFAYPNTERISEKTSITGNLAADDHIRAIAKARGYELRGAPVVDTFQEVAPDMRLQQRAAQPWLDMQAAAQKENITLGLSAAYRSAQEQTQIFTSRLAAVGVTIERIPSGQYDKQITTVLQSTAVPDYSRHHTGYTIDITCVKMPGVSFVASNCFKWLSADNYKNAKTYGWIPSYPEGTGQQGPEPEAWEYVWVGIDTLME